MLGRAEIVREYKRLYRLALPEIDQAAQLRYDRSPKRRLAKARHNRSPKGRATKCLRAHRYRHSLKGRETENAWRRRYRRTKKGKAVSLVSCVRRRALKLKAFVSGNQSALAKVYARAQELRQWFDVVVDHIVPLCKGGAHSHGNLQIIYRRENAAKGARLDYKPSVIFI